MLMISKSKADLQAKLSKDAKQIRERAAILSDPEIAGEDIV